MQNTYVCETDAQQRIDHTAALRWQREFGSSYAPPPLGTPVQRATAETYREYLRGIMGVELPLGEVLAITTVGPAGLRRAPDTSKATAGIYANTVSPEFGKVQAPALALYSDVSAQDAFPWLQGEAAERAALVYSERQRPEMLIERQRFAAALKGARIAAYPGHHYEFLRVARRDGQVPARVSHVAQVISRDLTTGRHVICRPRRSVLMGWRTTPTSPTFWNLSTRAHCVLISFRCSPTRNDCWPREHRPGASVNYPFTCRGAVEEAAL